MLNRLGVDVVRHPQMSDHAHRRNKLLATFQVDAVLDIGANEGQYGSELRAHGYTGRIVSFEPTSHAYALLRDRADRDPFWITVNSALGDCSGEMMINVSQNSVSSSFVPMLRRHEMAAPDSRYTSREKVVVASLDDVFDQHCAGSRKPFVKIDVQGFERRVLSGSKHTLDRVVGLQLEMSMVPLYEDDLSFGEAMRFTDEMGFRLMSIEPGFADPHTGELLQWDGVFFRDT